ncbi:MAG: hypothetical protein WD114_05220 [Phycisphaerales bacterium]
MKKPVKIILIVVAVLVLLVIGIVVLGIWQVDRLTKAAIERGGTYAMQVDTTVDTVDVKLRGGTATMSGLRIDNPQGFETDHFFTLADANASVNLKSISTDTILMPEIRLSGIDVILDKGQTPSNYNRILENLKRFETRPREDAKRVVIDSLVLENISVRVANMPGISLAVGDVAVRIPEITLTDVGKDKSMTTGEVINLVVKTVLAAAVEAGGGIIPADVLGELGNGLAGLESLSDLGIEAISDLDIEGTIGKAAEDVQRQIDDAAKGVEDKIDDATRDIRDIFNRPRQNQEEPEEDPEGPVTIAPSGLRGGFFSSRPTAWNSRFSGNNQPTQCV